VRRKLNLKNVGMVPRLAFVTHRCLKHHVVQRRRQTLKSSCVVLNPRLALTSYLEKFLNFSLNQSSHFPIEMGLRVMLHLL
jgi:hypothetical protein